MKKEDIKHIEEVRINQGNRCYPCKQLKKKSEVDPVINLGDYNLIGVCEECFNILSKGMSKDMKKYLRSLKDKFD